MPFCEECGSHMTDSATFCPECGARNKSPVVAAQPTQSSPTAAYTSAPSSPKPVFQAPASPKPVSTSETSSASSRPTPPSRSAPRISAPTRAPPVKPPGVVSPVSPGRVATPTRPQSSGPPPAPYSGGPPPAPGASSGPPPAPGSLTDGQRDMEVQATLLALNKFNDQYTPTSGPQKAMGVGVTPSAQRRIFKGSDKKEWCMQLEKADLKGEGVFSTKTLHATRILMKIFSFGDADDLFRCAEVCREWNVFTEMDLLWEPLKKGEPSRMEKALNKKKTRYLRMERINVRIHVPARARRPKDFVIGVRTHSKLWSEFPMEFRGFWAKQDKESRTAQILAKDHERSATGTYHTEGDIKCIVIDNGTAFIRAGFSAEKFPHLVIPSLLAYQETKKKESDWVGLPELRTDNEGNIMLHALGTYGCLVGSEVHDLALSTVPPAETKELEKKQAGFTLSRVTTQTDEKQTWEDWGNVWSYVFNNLQLPGSKTKGIDPTQHPILITQPIFAPRFVREKFTQMLFEQFNVPAVHISWAPLASAYGYEITTGLCLDIGEAGAQIVPIFEGTIVETAMKRVSHLGGAQLTQYLMDHLHIRGTDWYPGMPPCVKSDESEWRKYQLTTVIRNVKERLGRVAPMGEYSKKVEDKENVKEFKPDTLHAKEKLMTVGREAYDMGEVYFDPKSLLDDVDTSIVSLPQMIQQVVDACPLDTREKILGNIILSGGGSEVPGFYERLEAEVKALYKDTSVLAKAVSVKAALDRKHRVWIGGAELARLGMGQDHVWLTRDSYQEYGAWGPSES